LGGRGYKKVTPTGPGFGEYGNRGEDWNERHKAARFGVSRRQEITEWKIGGLKFSRIGEKAQAIKVRPPSGERIKREEVKPGELMTVYSLP